MDGPSTSAPDAPAVGEQRSQIQRLMDQSNELVPGDKWYPVPLRWWDAWKKHVGVEGGEDAVAHEHFHPGAMHCETLQGETEEELNKQVGEPLCRFHRNEAEDNLGSCKLTKT